MNQKRSKDEEASDAMKVIFNYNNIFFSFFCFILLPYSNDFQSPNII